MVASRSTATAEGGEISFEADAQAVIIEQRLGLQWRRAEIQDDGVEVSYRGIFARERWKVRFEDLVRDPVEFAQQPERMSIGRAVLLGLGLLFLFLSVTREEVGFDVGMIFAALCLAAAGLGALLERLPVRRIVQLSSGNPPLLLFADRPSVQEMTAFQEALFARAREFLKEHYGDVDPGLTVVEQLERLWALLKEGAISEEEYKRLKGLLTGEVPAASSGQYL